MALANARLHADSPISPYGFHLTCTFQTDSGKRHDRHPIDYDDEQDFCLGSQKKKISSNSWDDAGMLDLSHPEQLG